MLFDRHPLSAAFPSMPASEQDELTLDIEKNGQREPIIIFDGMILDGWHRYNACNMLEIEPVVSNLPSDVDPVSYVISRNIHRRHLTSSQRAAAIVSCFAWSKAGDNQHTQSGVDAASIPLMSNSAMASMVGVSPKTIQRAKRAEEAGLTDAVKSGAISVEQAAIIAKLPESERAAAVENPPRTKPATGVPPEVPVPTEETVTLSKSDYDELIALSEDMHASQQEMEAVLSADDKLSAAAAEIRSLNEQVRVLRSRLHGEQNKNSELIKIVKGKDKQIAKLEKELETYKLKDLPL